MKPLHLRRSATASTSSTCSKTAEALPRGRSSSSRDIAAEGGTVLFVGTKRQAQDAIAEEAQRCGMLFVNERWLGGTLTNFRPSASSLARLRELEEMVDRRAATRRCSKKEIAPARPREDASSQKNLDGIRDMDELPDAHLRHRPRKHEHIAVGEAHKLEDPDRSASSTPTATPTWSTTSSPATTTRSAPSGCSRARSPTRYRGSRLRESAAADAPPAGDAPAEAPRGAARRRPAVGAAAPRARRRDDAARPSSKARIDLRERRRRPGTIRPASVDARPGRRSGSGRA